MEISTIKDHSFLHEWLSQMHTKVEYVSDKVLTEALQYIEEQGIPSIKNEAYRNIPIESLLKRYFRKIQTNNETVDFSIENKQPNTVYFQGEQTHSFIQEESIKVYSSKNIPEKFLSFIGASQQHTQDFFAALNTAYCPNITLIHITQSLKNILHLKHIISSSANFHQNRILIVLDKEVKCTVFEEYLSTLQQNTFYNHLCEVYINEGAKLNWINLQNEPSQYLYSIHNQSFFLEKSASLTHHQITLNGNLWRNNLNIHINSSEANCELKGLSIGKNQSIISQNTAVLHHIGYSNSNQLYKHIANDKSTVLFNGFILVDKNAQKTNAYQSSKNLLLNDNATIFAKPQLEIYADDVKCSHGSSTGALNEDALFYLQARGIDKPTAQKLLLHAFFSDIIESIENTTIKGYITSQIKI